MDAGTVNDSPWLPGPGSGPGTARSHRAVVAARPVLDAAPSAAAAAQNATQTRMRPEVAQHGPGNVHARRQ